MLASTALGGRICPGETTAVWKFRAWNKIVILLFISSSVGPKRTKKKNKKKQHSKIKLYNCLFFLSKMNGADSVSPEKECDFSTYCGLEHFFHKSNLKFQNCIFSFYIPLTVWAREPSSFSGTFNYYFGWIKVFPTTPEKAMESQFISEPSSGHQDHG